MTGEGVSDEAADIGITDEQREIASLRVDLAHFRAKDEELWRERLNIINALGLAEAMDRGASFEQAVIDFARNPDFIAGFKAARDEAAAFAAKQSLGTMPSEFAMVIRRMQPIRKAQPKQIARWPSSKG